MPTNQNAYVQRFTKIHKKDVGGVPTRNSSNGQCLSCPPYPQKFVPIPITSTNDMNDFEDDDKKVGTNYLLVTNLP